MQYICQNLKASQEIAGKVEKSLVRMVVNKEISRAKTAAVQHFGRFKMPNKTYCGGGEKEKVDKVKEGKLKKKFKRKKRTRKKSKQAKN